MLKIIYEAVCPNWIAVNLAVSLLGKIRKFYGPFVQKPHSPLLSPSSSFINLNKIISNDQRDSNTQSTGDERIQ